MHGIHCYPTKLPDNAKLWYRNYSKYYENVYKKMKSIGEQFAIYTKWERCYEFLTQKQDIWSLIKPSKLYSK